MSGPAGSASQQNLTSACGDYETLIFIISQTVARLSTVKMVKVLKVTSVGALAPVGYVDVQAMVNQVDGELNPVPTTTLSNVPYFRLQGGANAIVMDPQVGDIGMCGFCDRDTSIVKNTRKQANPGSFRQYDISDGLYFGGFLNGTPTQFVQFTTAGIQITSPTAIALSAPDIKLTAPTVEINASTSVTVTTPTFNVTGAIVATGNVTGAALVASSGNVTAGSIDLKTHVHTGVQTGSGNTGGPTG